MRKLALATRSAHPLLVVEPLGRHVGHHYGLQRTDIDSDLHRGRHAQYVDAVTKRMLTGGGSIASLNSR